jgi:hypothetical protein
MFLTSYSFSNLIHRIVQYGGKNLLSSYGDIGRPNANGLISQNQSGWVHARHQYRAGTYLWVNVGLGNIAKIDDALRAIETAYTYQNLDGSLKYPPDTKLVDNFAGHGFFLSETTYALLVLSQSAYASQFQDRINTLLPKVSKLAHWLSKHPNWEEANSAENEGKYTNHALYNGSSLFYSGLLLNDESLKQAGDKILNETIARQDPTEGWYLEVGNFNEYGEQIPPVIGGDSSYQFLNLLKVIQIATQKQDVNYENSFTLGWNWAYSKIDSTGHINTLGNTRVPNEGKDPGLPDIIAGILMAGAILDSPEIVATSQTVLQAFREQSVSISRSIDENTIFKLTDVDGLLYVADVATRGKITIVGNEIIYDPTQVFNPLEAGKLVGDSFSYTVQDAAGIVTNTRVSLSISGVNDVPVAGDDQIAAKKNVPITIAGSSLLANDSDIDLNTTLQIINIDDTATLGAVIFDSLHNTITYHPGTQFAHLGDREIGTDSFTYTITDNNGGTATATVTLNINAPLPSFEEATNAAGLLVFRDDVGIGGQGVALGDYDNDGYVDILTTEDNGNNRLFKNQGNGNFLQISGSISGIRTTDPSRDAEWGDYDNDGDLDLYVASYGSSSRLYKNNGDGKFTDVTETAGVSAYSHNARNVAWADYDADGDLDLFVTIAADSSPLVSQPDIPYIPRSNIIYQNNGDGTFADVTQTVGLYREGDWVLMNLADYNNDGYLDVHVVSGDKRYPYLLYFNNGNGTFTEVSEQAKVREYGSGRGSAWGDYDNDGDLDLYVTNQSVASGNRLYRNNGDGTFVDVAASLGIVAGKSRSASWIDYDHDGDLDLFVANDFTKANKLYRNDGGYGFTEVAKQEGLIFAADSTGRGSGSAWADINNDGTLDLYAVHRRTPSRFYSNIREDDQLQSLPVRVLDTQGHFTRQGTQVRLFEADTGNLVGTRMIGSNTYLGQGAYEAYFSVDPTKLYNVEVMFPGGIILDKTTIPSLENINPQSILQDVGYLTILQTSL